MQRERMYSDGFGRSLNRNESWYEEENINPYIVLNLIRRTMGESGKVALSFLLVKLNNLGLEVSEGMLLETINTLYEDCAGIEIIGSYVYYDENEDFVA